jgi:hypothetical protein
MNMVRSSNFLVCVLASALVIPGATAQTVPARPAIPNVVGSETVPDLLIRENRTPVTRILGPARDFANNCQGCHGHTGASVDEVPTLRSRVGFFARLPEGRAYLIKVPNVALAALDDARLAALMTWLLRTFSSDELPPDFANYTAEEVGQLRQARIDPAAERRSVVEALVRRGILPGEEALALAPFRNY